MIAARRQRSQDETPQKRRTGSNSLLSASLLAFSGGMLDAFLYITHDKVFAGAMTGNAVLSGIALLSHKRGDALHHLNPLVAFLCGVFVAELLQERLKKHAATIALSCELTGVLIASFLPGTFPGDLFVFLLSFLAAIQVSSFRRTDEQSYNSTFISGNLRQAVVGLCELLKPEKRSEGLLQARVLSTVVLSFLAGAAASALLAPQWRNHTLWITFAALLIVLLSVLRRGRSDAG